MAFPFPGIFVWGEFTAFNHTPARSFHSSSLDRSVTGMEHLPVFLERGELQVGLTQEVEQSVVLLGIPTAVLLALRTLREFAPWG